MPAQLQNAKEIEINVVGGSSFGRYPKISGEKTYNMFESDGWLVPSGGFIGILELIETGGKGRGAFNSIRGGFILAVVNANVYTISPTFGSTLVGTLNTQAGPVFIDENLNGQICIVDGSFAYIYNYRQGPVGINVQTNGDLGTGKLIPNYVTYHNTYFLFGNRPTGTSAQGSAWYAYVPNMSDPTQITELDLPLLAVQTKPDYAIAIKRIPGQSANVLVFGTTVCEIWTNVGGTQIYRKNTSVSIDFGCVSVDTIASSDLYIAWIGVNEANSPVVMIYTGQEASPISTDGISYLMGSIKFPAQSTAYFLREDGHLFYQFTFYNPADNVTLRYDFETKKFFHITDEALNYFPATDVVYFNGSNYFLSLNDGTFYELSTDLTNYSYNFANEEYLDWRYVHTIPRIRIPATIRSPRTSRYRAQALTLTIEQGVDNGIDVNDCETILIHENGTRLVSEGGIQLVPEGNGNNDCMPGLFNIPRVDLNISYDGTETFGNPDSIFMNPIGYRKNIMKWYQLGEANEMTPKFRFWSTGRIVVQNAVLDVY